MLPLPLTRSQERAFERALKAASRTIDIRVRLLRQDGKGLPVPLHLVDGEVVSSGISDDEPAQTCSVTVADPKGYFRLSPRMRHDGENWFSKSIQIVYRIWVFDLNGDSGGWVPVPVFTGRIVDVQRSGHNVDIGASSKDVDHTGRAVFARSFNVRRHTKVHKAIKAIARERGETRFKLTPTTKRLKKSRSWRRGASPWKAMQNLADSVDKMLYYRADGTLCLKRKPKHPSVTLKTGKDCRLVDYPVERISRDELVNVVVVRGSGRRQRKDEQKRPVVGIARLRASHPFSKQSIGVALVHTHRADKITKRSDARERAGDILTRRAHLDHEISFATFVDPRREIGDVVKINAGGINKRVRVRNFTLPLNLEATMEHNWKGRRKPKKRRAARGRRSA